MSNPILSFVVFFLCLACVATAQPPTAKPDFVYEAVVYPAEVYFGDPVYIFIYLKNTSEEPVASYTEYGRNSFWLSLQSDSVSVPYHLLHEYIVPLGNPRVDIPPPHIFQPGESMLVFMAYQELPTLEDMNHPFWEEAKKRLNTNKNIIAHVTAEKPRYDTTPTMEPNTTFTSGTITISPRLGNEMELVKHWLEGTPEKLRPVPFDQMVAEGNYWYAGENLKDKFDAIPLISKPDFMSKERDLKINRNDRFHMASNERFIKVQNQDYFPYFFVRHGNRKPGDPVCPETWQGWKELEEVLSPSTMRDEIRLTRMLIQYCDTEDDAVLKELEEWFTDMNNIQRTFMAKNIFDLAWGAWEARNTNLLDPYSKIYATINEYDVVAKPEYMKKYLAVAGLYPYQPRIRMWNSVNGKFQTEAKYISSTETQVILEKKEGGQTMVDLEKLSAPDREYVRRRVTVEKRE